MTKAASSFETSVPIHLETRRSLPEGCLRHLRSWRYTLNQNTAIRLIVKSGGPGFKCLKLRRLNRFSVYVSNSASCTMGSCLSMCIYEVCVTTHACTYECIEYLQTWFRGKLVSSWAGGKSVIKWKVLQSCASFLTIKDIWSSDGLYS